MQHVALCLKMHVPKFKTSLLKLANDHLSLCWFVMSSQVLGLVALTVHHGGCGTDFLNQCESRLFLPQQTSLQLETLPAASHPQQNSFPSWSRFSQILLIQVNVCEFVLFLLFVYVYLFVCVTCVAVPSEVLSEDGEVLSSIEPSFLFLVWYFKALIISTTFKTSSPEVFPSQELTPLVCKK